MLKNDVSVMHAADVNKVVRNIFRKALGRPSQYYKYKEL